MGNGGHSCRRYGGDAGHIATRPGPGGTDRPAWATFSPVGHRQRRRPGSQSAPGRRQDEGGAIMGLGHTLMEHIILDDSGRNRHLGAIDYRIATSKDLSLKLHSVSAENADGPGPCGVKWVSEESLLAVSPTVRFSMGTWSCVGQTADLEERPRSGRHKEHSGVRDGHVSGAVTDFH